MTRFEIVDMALQQEFAKPYRYGVSDCFFTGLAVIDAVRGTSHVKTYAGRYKTLRGAQTALRREGYETLVAFMAALLGRRIAPLLAHTGDIGIISLPIVGKPGRMAEHVGVHTGRQWVVKAEEGIRLFDSAQAVAAFRV